MTDRDASEFQDPGLPRQAVLVTTPPQDPEAPEQAQNPATTELLDLALADLRQRRAELESEIKELEGRRAVLQQELGASFAGQSDAIARRLKGFQDYLVGALQDLVIQAESMELVSQPLRVQPSPLDQQTQTAAEASNPVASVAAAGLFSQDEELIRDRLERFQGQPDFFADPWKLRRSLEPSGATLLDDWFLSQGGRGAQPSTGSRNRNALVAAAAIAILGELYGERLQTLVLAGQPERLGEWRRGLQDCLGLAREDFGPNSGIVLFERPDALIERADRLEERGELPLIVVDAAEQVVDIPILQFPLWLAFAPDPAELALEDDLL
ncbi:DUF3086 domain-containing protein [Cyanobium sp. Morenito 9A2]|nr:DUF3086 domain-containing protein [Cyanobium sp. Morenito 9A2]